jgi:hypothetical protein
VANGVTGLLTAGLARARGLSSEAESDDSSSTGWLGLGLAAVFCVRPPRFGTSGAVWTSISSSSNVNGSVLSNSCSAALLDFVFFMYRDSLPSSLFPLLPAAKFALPVCTCDLPS